MRTVGGERPSRDDAVHMAMRPQGLVPGVPHPGAPDLSTEVAVPKLHEGLARGVEQKREQRPLLGQHERVKVVGHSTHQVDRGHRQQLSFAILDPLDLGNRLTGGAVTIAAGVRGIPFAVAVRAPFDRAPQLRGAADSQVVHDLVMRRRHWLSGTRRVSIEAPEVGYCPAWCAVLVPPPAWGTTGGM